MSKLSGVEELDSTNTLSKESVGNQVAQKSERFVENINSNKAAVDLQDREAVAISEKSDSLVKSSSDRNTVKEADGFKVKGEEKKADSSRRQDDRHRRKDKTDDRVSSKDYIKDQLPRADEKAKEIEPRKRSSPLDPKGDRREAEKNGKHDKREEHSRKRERDKHKEEDRSKHRTSHGSSRHKRRRSSSIDSRGRSSEGNSSDETSVDSRRFDV